MSTTLTPTDEPTGQYPEHDEPLLLVEEWPEMEHDVILVGPPDSTDDEYLKYSGPLAERKDYK